MEYDKCVRCMDRVIGCHANCEHYKRYKQRMAKIRENKNKERLMDPKLKNRRGLN